MDNPPDQCDRLRDPGFATTTLALFILVGVVISYLPQHYRIIKRRTAEGISPYFVLLGTTSSTAAFANILTLPQTTADVGCCKVLSSHDCAAGLLGIAQIGVMWSCFFFIFVLFLVFFRYTDAQLTNEELVETVPAPKWQTAVIVGSTVLLHMLLIIIITTLFAWVYPGHMQGWANFLGIWAISLSAIQYFPQLWTTYHLKHVGSLSIPSMCIQVPGGFLFALSVGLRVGLSGWSAWAVLVFAACMQGTLLSMALYYAFKNKSVEESTSNDSAAISSRPDLPRTYSRVYANGMDEHTPGKYTGHPEHYADTQEQLGDINDRQDLDAHDETTPLLAPGGIGSAKTYDGGENDR